jgi:arylsulfatase A-like enzyme
MDRRTFIKHCAFSVGTVAGGGLSAFGMGRRPQAQPPVNRKPNIVYILADDLGYGDVSCLNRRSRIHTPNIDRLAEGGMIFTDAHSGSAVCTPTRYGILTGRYCWRSRLKSGVLNGFDRHLIEDGRMTVASMLKEYSYESACIGKWHLGWDWQMQDNNPKEVDYSKPILNGPTCKGFDYSFCIPASLDMPPYVYVENDRVTAAPNRTIEGQDGKRLFRTGVIGEDFRHIEVLPKFTEKAVSYLNDRGKKKDTPFFLYFALPAPHTPILPTPEFLGKSGTTEYGDFVLQVDWTVGRVLAALKDNGLEENTLVIFTSDNGCAPLAGIDELKKLGHDVSYIFRGHKADIFEGGHRIPYITRWPGRIKADSVCDDTICLTDLMATAAEIVGCMLPDNAGEDSVSVLRDFPETASGSARQAIVHHSVNGSFSIRQGPWKLVFCAGSGGWSNPRPNSDTAKKLPPIQLYDLNKDIGETTNVQDKHPEVVERLTALMERYIEQGRSTPGTPQKNNGSVNLYPK